MNQAHWREHVVFAFIDEPPFAWAEPGGADGCDIDLARTILQQLGVRRVELRLTTFAELLPGVAAGRWHVNTPLFVTPERAAQVAFSRPVWALHDGFVVAAGNPLGIDGYPALARTDARLAVISGQVQHQAALRAGVTPDRITTFDTQAQAVQAVRNRQVDAYASTAVGNRILVERLADPLLAAVAATPASGAEVPVGAFSFSHAAVELRQAFDAALCGHLGSLPHRRALARYGLGAMEVDPVLARSG